MAGPENRTGPDGRPVFEPPEGSRLTASAPLARISAISCERTKDVAVPLLSLGNNPSERGVPPGGTIQISRTLAVKSRGGLMLSRSTRRPLATSRSAVIIGRWSLRSVACDLVVRLS